MKNLYQLLILLVTLAKTTSQTMVYTNDFEGGPPFAGWDITSCATNPRTGTYLGKIVNNEVGNQQAVLSLDNMPDHQYVTVEFDFLTFYTWDGSGRSYNTLQHDSPLYQDLNCPDIFKVSAEGMTMVHTTFSSHDLEYYRYQAYPGTYPQDSYRAGTGAVALNTLGANWNLDWYKNRLPDAKCISDALYHFKLTFPSTNSWTDIVFQTFNTDSRWNSLFNDTDEYWGIDNISVVVSDTPISPVTIVQPTTMTKMVPNSSGTGAAIYTWGEAGTFLSIQSSSNPNSGYTDVKAVSFNGYYKYNTSFRSGAARNGLQSTRPRPAYKFFRAKLSK